MKETRHLWLADVSFGYDEVRFFGSADLMSPAEVQVVFYVKSYEYH